jgi:gluconolactonase
MARIETLCTGYGLIEGPVWDDRRGLLFADVVFGGVHAVTPEGKVSTVFPHRRGIGGMAPHAAGGLVVGGRNVGFKAFAGGDTVTLLEPDAEQGLIGFNDLSTDAEGRIYVGSLAFRPVGHEEEPRPGSLHVIDLDGSSRTLAGGILLTNGIGVSPDGKWLYHADSRTQALWRYAKHADGGVGPRQKFVAVEPPGIPDGIAVAEDGSIWIAIAYGKAVQRYSAAGELLQTVEMPLPMVTSVCFGGPDLRQLYVVSGSRGTQSERAGTVWRFPVDAPGLPIAPARVPILST